MSWKNKYKSFYYENAGDPEDLKLDAKSTALLVIDIQNEWACRKPRETLSSSEQKEWDRWDPFHQRMQKIVIPNVEKMLKYFRKNKLEVIFAHVASLTQNGRDRSLSQKKPGFNNLLLPFDSLRSQIIEALEPHPDEIVVKKTTDSTLTGTNLRLILRNIGITDMIVAGIFTDQCVSSTVRTLADESFNVIVLKDCCTAATDELHESELKIINNIYCHVMSFDDAIQRCDSDPGRSGVESLRIAGVPTCVR